MPHAGFRVIDESIPETATLWLLWIKPIGEAWEAPTALARGEQLKVDDGDWGYGEIELTGLLQVELAAGNLKVVNGIPILIGKQRAFDKHPIKGPPGG